MYTGYGHCEQLSKCKHNKYPITDPQRNGNTWIATQRIQNYSDVLKDTKEHSQLNKNEENNTKTNEKFNKQKI